MKAAYELGKKARAAGRMNVSPFYEVKEMRNGKRVDVTEELDRFWFLGYGGFAYSTEPREVDGKH